MSKKNTIAQHHDAIVSMRAEGKTAQEIAAALGVDRRSINRYAHKANLPAKPLRPRVKPARKYSVPIGSIYITSHFTPEEIQALDRSAAKWGCATMAEAAIEILKDALTEADVMEAAE